MATLVWQGIQWPGKQARVGICVLVTEIILTLHSFNSFRFQRRVSAAWRVLRPAVLRLRVARLRVSQAHQHRCRLCSPMIMPCSQMQQWLFASKLHICLELHSPYRLWRPSELFLVFLHCLVPHLFSLTSSCNSDWGMGCVQCGGTWSFVFDSYRSRDIQWTHQLGYRYVKQRNDSSFTLQAHTEFEQCSGSATDMTAMFCRAEAFNQPLNLDTSKVTSVRVFVWSPTAWETRFWFSISHPTCYQMRQIFLEASFFDSMLDIHMVLRGGTSFFLEIEDGME